ncbi:MAG: GTP 3',8-cyclase MoaA [Pseudomonadota bacterium]
MNSKPAKQLIDRFNRKVTYLRLSVTDRCDLRCVYCMSENMKFVPRAQLLSLEELIRLGQAAVNCGITKIRLTGGEPLTRQNILKVVEAYGQMSALKELTITTNGTLLDRYAQSLKDAGVDRINISLDTLREDRFHKITRVGDIKRTLKGIEAALKAGFKRIKINSVVLKNRNHDEILDLVSFIKAHDMDISFIEEMPLGTIAEHNRAETYYSSDNILTDIEKQYQLIPSAETTGGPSRYYRFADSYSKNSSKIGFISPHSHNFCSSCNRIRITAEGRLLLCLGQENSVDLRRVIRANPLDDQVLEKSLMDSMLVKPEKHDFDLSVKPVIFRYMNETGG